MHNGVATDTSAAFGKPTDNFGRRVKGRLMERDGPPVQVTAIDAVGIITLSDPTRRNALSLEMRNVLQPATEELLNDARIRSLVGPNEGSAALIFRGADDGAAGKRKPQPTPSLKRVPTSRKASARSWKSASPASAKCKKACEIPMRMQQGIFIIVRRETE
jgi:hypothetical protein